MPKASKDSSPHITICHLTHIYGRDPQAALKRWQQGMDRQGIFQSGGQVLALADISLEIARGELFVVMGLSGSGKSTLIRCLNRLITPTQGEIIIDGQSLQQMSPLQLRQFRRTKVAMVFQKFALFPHRTVFENVEYGLKVQGIPKSLRAQRTQETLGIVGLEAWGNRYPGELSGGMQQRVGLARALATNPDILLMDEAFSALDPLTRREMQQELLRLQAQFHKTIVFITHDIQEALKLGDRVAILREGSLVQVGSPVTLLTEPADDYVRAFTQEVSRARVLTSEVITQPTPHLVLGQDSLTSAAHHLHHHGLESLYVLNDLGIPIGVLTSQGVQSALAAGNKDLSTVLIRDFPQVMSTTTLETLFQFWNQSLPIAVVNDQGCFQGIVRQSDFFSLVAPS